MSKEHNIEKLIREKLELFDYADCTTAERIDSHVISDADIAKLGKAFAKRLKEVRKQERKEANK